MPVTEEPRGLKFLNNLNPNTLSAVAGEFRWTFGSVVFTVLACFLMTRFDRYEAVGAFVDGLKSQQGQPLRQMVLVSHETMRQLGNSLTIALLGAWSLKTGLGVTDAHLKRKVYATEKIAETQANALPVTGERPAMRRPSTAEPIISEEPLP